MGEQVLIKLVQGAYGNSRRYELYSLLIHHKAPSSCVDQWLNWILIDANSLGRNKIIFGGNLGRSVIFIGNY